MQQQQAMLQERFRMEQERMGQQRLQAQQQQINNSPHVGSPLTLPGGGNDNFPALRSNSTIPGIARSTRSPSDGAPSPMTPRITQRGVSVGQEDFQRMMMQQQQQQQQNQQRGMQQGFNPQQMQQQQPTHWQQQMGGHNQGFGMSRPPSAGFGVPSPPGGGGNWQQGGGGSYPFAPSPGSHSDLAHTPRHMSATPIPQQMHSQNNTPTVEPPLPTDLDLFNWAQ